MPVLVYSSRYSRTTPSFATFSSNWISSVFIHLLTDWLLFETGSYSAYLSLLSSVFKLVPHHIRFVPFFEIFPLCHLTRSSTHLMESILSEKGGYRIYLKISPAERHNSRWMTFLGIPCYLWYKVLFFFLPTKAVFCDLPCRRELMSLASGEMNFSSSHLPNTDGNLSQVDGSC